MDSVTFLNTRTGAEHTVRPDGTFWSRYVKHGRMQRAVLATRMYAGRPDVPIAEMMADPDCRLVSR